MRPHEFITIVESFRIQLLEIDATARLKSEKNITQKEIADTLNSIQILIDIVSAGGLKECFDGVENVR